MYDVLTNEPMANFVVISDTEGAIVLISRMEAEYAQIPCLVGGEKCI